MSTLKQVTALLLLPTWLISCQEGEEEQTERKAYFTTEVKAAPNPEKVDLESLLKKEFEPSDFDSNSIPQFELYSKYAGEDIHQLTGISGRNLMLCFTAPWCPHSQRMQDALKNLATQAQGDLQVVIVDADQYPVLAHDFGVNKVPTTFLYVEAVRLEKIEGSYSTQSLTKYIQRILSP